MGGGWGPPPFTAYPFTVTLFPTPAAYPGLTQVTPGDGRAHQAKRISPRGIPRRLGPHPGTSRGTALHPRCTPDAPEWAQLDDHSADKEQGKLVDSTRTWRRAFTPEGEYSQYDCIL